jgi:hypothetical protein
MSFASSFRRVGACFVWIAASSFVVGVAFVVLGIAWQCVPKTFVSVAGPALEHRRGDGSLRYRSETREDWPFRDERWTDGEFESWWDTGALHTSGAYVHRERHGTWCIYDERGVLMITAEFERGRLIGKVRCRDPETGVMYDSDADPDVYFTNGPRPVLDARLRR